MTPSRKHPFKVKKQQIQPKLTGFKGFSKVCKKILDTHLYQAETSLMFFCCSGALQACSSTGVKEALGSYQEPEEPLD